MNNIQQRRKQERKHGKNWADYLRGRRGGKSWNFPQALEEEASEVEVDVVDCEHINYSGSDMWDKYQV